VRARLLLLPFAAAACWGGAREAPSAPPASGAAAQAPDVGAVSTAGPAPAASAPALAVPATSASAGPAPLAGPSASAAGASSWQERCAAHVEGARRQASAIEREFRGASVEREGRAGGERLSIHMFPPTFRVGGFGFSVQRSPAAERALEAGPWGMWAESLHGSYHAMFHREAGVGEAFLSFDGWGSGEVQVIAPIFKAAADLCLEDRGP
jgi:hypothetical protein